MLITTKTEITNEHLMHLFIGVIESNASTYWAGGGVNVSDKIAAKYSNEGISWWWNPEYYDKAKIVIMVNHDAEGDSEGECSQVTVLTKGTIQRGLQLAARHFPKEFQEFARNEGFDITIADTIFQCIVLHDKIVEANTTGWNAPEKRTHVPGWQVVYG